GEQARAYTQQGADKGLAEGQYEGVDPGGQPAHGQDLQCPDKGAGQNPAVPGRQRKPLGGAEEIQADDRQQGARPDPGPGPVAEQGGQHGHNDHVEAGDETALAGGGGNQPDLLEIDAQEDQYARQ